MENKIRESNFELLRIITMLFIVLHHYVIHGLKIAGYTNLYPDSHPTQTGIFINSFLIIGVNVFILISGYFSINQSWKGFLRLYIICIFYNLLISFTLGEYPFLLALKGSLRPFSHSNFWFIKDYFFLWLLSPILNSMIAGVRGNKHKFVLLLLIFAIFQFYFGWFYQREYSGDGYNLWNFMFLYLIGRFIALHTKKNYNRKKLYLFSYIFFSILTATLMNQTLIGKIWFTNRLYDYNSPLIIISAVSFFLFFRNLRIKSKIINWLANSVLAVYLITESPWIGTKYLYLFVDHLGKIIMNNLALSLYIFCFAIITVFFCLLIDKLRIIISKPIESLLCKIPIEKYIKLLTYKITNYIN